MYTMMLKLSCSLYLLGILQETLIFTILDNKQNKYASLDKTRNSQQLYIIFLLMCSIPICSGMHVI